MKNFTISVLNKVAIAENPPEIICGNSDYVIDFVFDEEWKEYEVKTAVFTFKRNGMKKYIEVVFMGTQCNVPILTGIDEVEIGVYAGNLETTTGAIVKTKKSILCDVSKAEDPHNDVYCQLLEVLKEHYPLDAVIAAKEATEKALKAADGVEIVEQNHKAGLTFWVGTQAEYDSIETKAQNRFYIITDDKTEELLLQHHNEIISDCLKPWNVDNELTVISPKKDLGSVFKREVGDNGEEYTTQEKKYKIRAKHNGRIRVKFRLDPEGTCQPILQFEIKCNDETISTTEPLEFVIATKGHELYFDIDVKKGMNTFSIITKCLSWTNGATSNITLKEFHICANYDTPFIYLADDFIIKED